MDFKHSGEHAYFEEKIKKLIKSSNLDRKQMTPPEQQPTSTKSANTSTPLEPTLPPLMPPV